MPRSVSNIDGKRRAWVAGAGDLIDMGEFELESTDSTYTYTELAHPTHQNVNNLQKRTTYLLQTSR